MSSTDIETLKILQKIEDFSDYCYPVFKQYPKSERYAMVADMKQSIDKMVHIAIQAEKKYFKKTTLQDLDVEVAYMRTLVKRSYRLKFISEKKRGVMLEYLSEIGRMLGGWIKACDSRKK